MSEAVLDALVKLFALIGDIHDETVVSSREKDIVRTFLGRHLNQELVEKYMKMFEGYLSLYNSESIKRGTVEDRKRISLNSMRILGICDKINEELEQKQKIYIFIQLIEYISIGMEVSVTELEFLHTISASFYIPEADYENIRNFIMNPDQDIAEKGKLLIIDNCGETFPGGAKHILNEQLKGRIKFLNIASTNSYIFRYHGNENIYLNGQIILSGQTYFFDHGSSIRGSGIRTVYYSEVISQLAEIESNVKVYLDANNVSFRFRNSDNGIHNLSISEESGHLVGILGGSGVGKSTTLSILNGTLKPHKGKVLINGYDLYNEADRKHLKGVIGYVPQDDLLIEELTVFENLWFNARMCLSNLPDIEITDVVTRTLYDFDLSETRDLKVGNPLRKVISGGQRKRLNIALELIRQPTILFVDEPTSGLSSVDSEAVMNLLKEQTYKGKLVIVNIHQPASDIFKMFDKIMIIDKGGYQVWYGNPTEAIVYFKTITSHANPEEDQCIKCGNVDTDQILQIIEAKVIDERGKATNIRRVTPLEWAERFSAYAAGALKTAERKKKNLPLNKYSIPGLLKQCVIFFERDLLSKISDRQYIFMSLLGPPLLALVLAWFIRPADKASYVFSENENIPAYLFISVLTTFFFGLMISSQEIIKDRNLSWFSYLNSKVIILFIISAIQTFSFILVGNIILEIKGMTMSYWLILFTTTCSANILGLNISSAFSSVITIYTAIPFIIIPQLLFSGVLVKFDKLHLTRFSSYEYVPVLGDLMPARWSFEALAVEQFTKNRYESNFLKYDIKDSQNEYYNFLINQLEKDLSTCNRYVDSTEYRESVSERLTRTAMHIDQLSLLAGIKQGPWRSELNIDKFGPQTEKESILFLDSLKKYFMSLRKIAGAKKDSVSAALNNEYGNAGVVALRDRYENKKLRFILLDEEPGDRTLEQPDRIIPKYNRGFMIGTSRWGRAHYYAPVKRLGNLLISTYWFNLIIICLVALLMYIALCFDLLHRISIYFGSMKVTGFRISAFSAHQVSLRSAD
jgi:ABC-type multidrug transport system ATPase subunit